MKKTHYTILISSEPASPLRRITLSGGGIVLLSLGIAGLIAGCVVLACGYIGMRHVGDEYFALKNENAALREQLDVFENQYETVDADLTAIRETQERFLSSAGIQSKEDPLFGIGGPSPEDGELTRRHDLLISDMGNRLDELARECAVRERTLQELLIFFDTKNDLLDATPSVWPARGFLSSGFGFRRDPFTHRIKMHEGLDIANKAGTSVFAAADGIAVFCGFESGYGRLITIDHGYGYKTRYGHLDSILINMGDKVQKGEKIGTIGCTGRCTGPHLHYEVRVNDVPVNPKRYVTDEAQEEDAPSGAMFGRGPR
jgi:murein DD-endopeptidase MepM/ murein hydrolase activator NlpD